MDSGKPSLPDNDVSFEEEHMDETPVRCISSKSRKPNWTSHEIRSLILAYDKNRTVLRSRGVFKGTGERVVNNAKRQLIWEAITEEVNKSRPDFVRVGTLSYSNCVRTVKEVVKKWVNLVNKMKQDMAMQSSNPQHEPCATSRAVHTIMNTDEPLQFDDSALSKVWDTTVGAEYVSVKTEPGPYYSEDSLNSADDYQTDNSYHHYSYANGRRSSAALDISNDSWNNHSATNTAKHSHVPSDLKAVLNRHLKLVSNSDNSTVEDGPSGGKKPKLTHKNGVETVEPIFQPNSNMVSSCYSGVSTNDPNTALVDEDLKATYRLNKEIMELQKRKLEVEIERIVAEKEKAEVEKEQLLVEKDVSSLRREKLQLELETLRQSRTAKVTDAQRD